MKAVGLFLDDVVDESDRQRVGGYLAAAQVLLLAAGSEDDELDPERRNIAAIGLATDGVFVWPLSLAYYVEEYGVGVAAELMAHMRQREFVPTEVSSSELVRLREELREVSRSSSDARRRPDEGPPGSTPGDDAWG